MNKQYRQIAIKQIILRENITSQEELCGALKKIGLDATQATLSRDFKELGIARVSTPDGVHYELRAQEEEQRLKPLIGYEIESVDANETLIVIKTLPGRAQGVAELIDSMYHPVILGTIAGDNTIFIAPTTVERVNEVVTFLRDLMRKPARRFA